MVLLLVSDPSPDDGPYPGPYPHPSPEVRPDPNCNDIRFRFLDLVELVEVLKAHLLWGQGQRQGQGRERVAVQAQA